MTDEDYFDHGLVIPPEYMSEDIIEKADQDQFQFLMDDIALLRAFEEGIEDPAIWDIDPTEFFHSMERDLLVWDVLGEE